MLKKRFVNWKQPEEDLVIWKAYQMLDAGEYKSIGRAVLAAQELLLKPDRHRPRSSILSSTPRFKKRYAILGPLMAQKEKVKTEQVEPPEVHVPEIPEPEVIEPVVITEPITQIQKVQEPEYPVDLPISENIETTINDAIFRIADMFKKALIAELQATVKEALSEVITGVEKQTRTFDTIPRVVLPKVVVVGFKPGDQGDLNRTFGEKLKMTFIEERGSPVRLKNTAQNADFVVLNTAYCGHNYLEMVKDHKGLIRVENFKDIKDKLGDITRR